MTKPGYILLTIFLSLCYSHAWSQVSFQERAQFAGIDYQHDGFMYIGGIAVCDFDGDGSADIYITNGEGFPNQLYLNNKDETFSEVGQASGVADLSEGWGAICGDIDNDGDADIYLTNYFGENKLFLNNGEAFFTDATAEAGVGDVGPSTSAAFADYDNDGYLDIYVLNRSQAVIDYANRLYRNNGDGTFSDVTESSGSGDLGTSLAVGFFDYDNDNYSDIYVVNEFGRDGLYHNNGDGTFTNLARDLDIPVGAGMGVDFSDYDNDGDIDIYVTNLARDFLLTNNGDGTFEDNGETLGISNVTMAWGVNFFDFDNDGDEDIFVANGAMLWPFIYNETNVFYVNNGSLGFSERALDMRLDDDGDGRASVCFDFNDDGYGDLLIINVARGELRLFINQNSGNNWIKVKLEGTESNRSGVGAKIKVEAGGVTQYKEIAIGASFASMNSLVMGFGLNKEEIVEKMTVYWPSGVIQEFTDISVNRLLRINESAGIITSEEKVTELPHSYRLSQNYPNPFNPSTTIIYELPITVDVKLSIYNLNGQIIMQINKGIQSAGSHQIIWDASEFPSGIYFYKLQTGGFSKTKKMVLLK
ncbi:T9SS type A sorting domain-containing protein [Candidatus Marinimicrobia bacterium MT.SAG.3]|nr:T9SS type A sorting domain-containing protein [Candidatus Marinimicrobia bacterium MT.SAG.3]